jgi:hypothetical protein
VEGGGEGRGGEVREGTNASARMLGGVRADATCPRGRELHPRGCTVSTRTLFLPRPRTVKTRTWVKPRPRGKCGRGQKSGRKGRPNSNFHPKTSVMTTLGDHGLPIPHPSSHESGSRGNDIRGRVVIDDGRRNKPVV